MVSCWGGALNILGGEHNLKPEQKMCGQSNSSVWGLCGVGSRTLIIAE